MVVVVVVGGGGGLSENVCNLNILLLILNMHSEKYALITKTHIFSILYFKKKR